MENTENLNDNKNQIQKSEFWLGLEQYYEDSAFAKKAETEFLSSPLKEDDGNDGFARREFLKLMGASFAMATTAGCVRPVQHIIPYAQAPKEITPGEAAYYASSWFDGHQGYGLVVKTLEGRPIKVEGNPRHPMNRGGLPARAHAEVLSLYDPDRIRGPKRNLLNKARTNFENVNAKWDEVDTAVSAAAAKGGFAIMTPTIPSPTTSALIADVLGLFKGKQYIVDTLPMSSVREAQRLSYGKDVLPRYRFDLAKIIVSIDCDFLGTYLSPAEFGRDFASRRTPGENMNRLVAFESLMSLTGMNADDRIRIKTSQQLDVVLGLIHAVNQKLSSHFVSAPIKEYVAKYANIRTQIGADEKVWNKLVADLVAAKGHSLIIAGGMTTETAEAVSLQVAVNLLNSILENDGATIDHESGYLTNQGSAAELRLLIADMTAGKIKTLVINDANYAYTLPRNSGFVEALDKVDLVLYTGNYNNAMGGKAHYLIPSGNSMESWTDYEFQKGVFSIGQPTIRPMYETRSLQESLLAWAAKAASAPAKLKVTWFEYLQTHWKTEIFKQAGSSKSFDDAWYDVLQTGVAGKSQVGGKSSRSFSGSALSTKRAEKPAGYELSLYTTVQMGDGKFANVSWLQELPDVVSKMVWDNYLSVSIATAEKENLKQGSLVELTVGKTSVKVPVHIQPGQADGVLGLAIGYGQKNIGKVGSDVGVDAFQFADFREGQTVFAGLSASIKKTGEKYELVSTQTHHSMEGRQIVAEATNEAYQKNNATGIEKVSLISIWPEHKYTKNKWAMSIDLNVCNGCSACVIACQSENNIPVVGKKFVMQGREMHWIRIDRYYRGEPASPDTVFQPMLCQQCENAPCETVCPVVATVHNEEGLNDMIYNRCVGTRYCSNNCPYKVRRFNWFNYSKRAEPLHMALNPDVTVRTRGVMEKCSFCVQRIRKTTGEAKDKHEKLQDGAIVTACAESCPTQAIVFGDLNDPNSKVSKLFEKKNSYAVLADLNTRPRVQYESKIRNAERASEEGEQA